MTRSPKAPPVARSTKAATSSKLVLTPGGWRPRSQVHDLERGHAVSGKDGRLKIVDGAERLIKDLGEISGADRIQKKPRRSKSWLAAATNDYGWIEYGQWSNDTGQPIVSLTAAWTVPQPPAASNDGQSIFLFPGLQQGPQGPYILQPVLQWGVSQLGGGAYWSVSNWYVNGPGSKAIKGPTPVQVDPGDRLTAAITMTGQNGGKFDYTCSILEHPEVDIDVTDIDELAYACIVLECYGASPGAPLSQCADYPAGGSVIFDSITLVTGPNPGAGVAAGVTWDIQTPCSSCGQACNAAGNGAPGASLQFKY